jgi:GNAT superfamily N-acetyltransferase
VSPQTWRQGELAVSTDPSRLDVHTIHAFLFTSYWAHGIPLETVSRSLEGSLAFGVYDGSRQIGLARVITDRATFAYLADVFIVESHRGRGLSKWLLECILAHPELQDLRRWLLATRDAHGLYGKFGFGPLVDAERFMQIKTHPYTHHSPVCPA